MFSAGSLYRELLYHVQKKIIPNKQRLSSKCQFHEPRANREYCKEDFSRLGMTYNEGVSAKREVK